MKIEINGKKTLRSLMTCTLLTLFLFYSGVGLAEVFTLNIKIEVVEKSCDIYGELGPNQPIEIKFGEMNLNGFSSERYRQEINYYLDCDDKSSGNPSLKLLFDSANADFDPTLVATSNDNLGLKILADERILSPNEFRHFSYSQKPLLSVLPILNPEEEIELGPFTSTGVLKVEYQ